MSTNQRWVSGMIIFNSALYTLFLVNQWLAPADAARSIAYVLASVGVGSCAIFGAKLIPAQRDPN